MTGGPIEVIARAVIIRKGRLLVVRRKGAANTFLPGGHIEHGEAGPRAIARELEEELGIKVTAGPLLAVVEHAFPHGRGTTQEINLVFTVVSPELDPDRPVRSCEAHLEFLWAACDATALAGINLQPWPLQQALAGYHVTGRMDAYMETLSDGGGTV